MATKPQNTELPASLPDPTPSREWILDEHSARQLFIATIGTSQKAAPEIKDAQAATSAERSARQPTQDKLPEEKSTSGLPPQASDALTEGRSILKRPWILSLGLGVVLSSVYVLSGLSERSSDRNRPIVTEAQQRRLPPAPALLRAPDPETFSVSPSLSVIQCEPGETASQTLSIINGTSHEFTFEVTAQDLVINEGKALFVPAGSVSNGLAATAVFSQRYVNVKPQQTISMSATFTVHPQTSARGMLVVLRGTEKVDVGPATTMTPTLGALVAVCLRDKLASPNPESPVSPLTIGVSYAFSQWLSDMTLPKAPPIDSPSAISREAGSVTEGAGSGQNPGGPR